MLEKMGWSKGKGLGVKEDGEQNFIRVAHKTDQKGMGFQDRDDQWTAHENQFNSLLISLDNPAKSSDDEANEEVARTGFGFASEKKAKKSVKSSLSGKSLEEMSKKSSARVHYRKFTRGKDISRYSEKDLANIFGKKFIEEDNVVEEPVKVEEEEVPCSNYGITTIETGTTIHDYFKTKKNGLKRTAESDTVDGAAEKKHRKKEKKLKESKAQETDTATELAVSSAEHSTSSAEKATESAKQANSSAKESKSSEQPTQNGAQVQLDDEHTIDIDELPKKQKKKNKSKNEAAVEHTIVVPDEDSDCELVSVKTKKKKKSKKSAESTEADECDAAGSKKKRKSTEVNTIKSESNTQFIDGILDLLARNSAANHSNATEPPYSRQIAMDEIYEINRYHAEMFRFVDLDGFPSANLSDLCGYGFNKDFQLKVSEKSKDQNKINDLWDSALINKYGKEVIEAKKAKRYSAKQLKKKNLFMKV